jgi:hypothetical protein
MDHYAGIDVSLECSSVCVVDANGKIGRETKVASEPETLIGWFGSLGFGPARIGLEAGPLSLSNDLCATGRAATRNPKLLNLYLRDLLAGGSLAP